MGTSVTPNMGLIEPDANQTNRWQSYNSDMDILDAGYRLTVTAGAAISQFQALFLDSTGKAQLATSANRFDGIAAVGAALGGSLFMQVWGVVTNPTWTWTPGSAVYVSPSSAGALTQTPSAQPVGVALSATQLWIMPPPRLQFLTTGKTPAVYTGSGEPSATTLPVGTTFNLLDLYLDTQTLQVWVCSTSGTNSTAVWKKGWRVYTGSGAPSATTLAAGTYEIGDQYVDTSGKLAYLCVTAGSNSTSVWVTTGRVYTGSGAPGVSTLPGGNVQFFIGDLYINTAANTLYYASAAGTSSTSVWTQISGGGGASTVLNDQGSLLVLNTTTETTLYTFTVAANTMTTTKRLRLSLAAEYAAATALSNIIRFYVGTLVVFSWSGPSVAGGVGLRILWELFLNGTLSSANNTNFHLGATLTSTAARGGAGATVTVDSAGTTFLAESVDDTIDWTAAQTIKITVQPSVAQTAGGVNRGQCTLEQV